MEMTYQQYIDNPMGKRNAVFSQRDMFRAFYTDKFDKVILREAGKIDFTLYLDKEKDKYAIHIKIPSETVKAFYYDAVILFYTNDVAARSSPSLQNYFVKFFSNDPAFVFTYLRVFLKNDLLLEDLKSKCSKLALTKDPNQTNPYQTPGYVKVLYFAYLFMKSRNLFAKHMYDSYGKKYNPKELLKVVEHCDEKIAKREEAGKQQSAEIRRAKKEENRQGVERNIISHSGNITKSSESKNVRRTTTSKTSKTTNKTKTVKKI